MLARANIVERFFVIRSPDTEWIQVTLIRGLSGRSETQRRTLTSLGLRRIGKSTVLPNVNSILGQINKVIHLVRVDPATRRDNQ